MAKDETGVCTLRTEGDMAVDMGVEDLVDESLGRNRDPEGGSEITRMPDTPTVETNPHS